MKARAALSTYGWDLIVNGVIASKIIPRRLRASALRVCGLAVGRAAIASGGFVGGRRVQIGEGTFLNHGVIIDNAAPVKIGKRCQVGMGVMILTGSHDIGGHEQRAQGSKTGPVVIGDGSWIGARAVILPGVTVGNGCVIAAGAVVIADCEPDSVYAGVPATLKRSL